MKFKSLSCLLLISAAAALAQPNVTAWDILNKGCAETRSERRAQAISAVATIGLTPEVVRLVEQGLRDLDPVVRQTAAAALGQIKSHQSVPFLQVALQDQADEVSFTAAKALWDMGERSGRQELEDVLTGESKSSPGLMDGAVRDAKRKMRDPKALAMIGVKEASGALLGPFSIGVVAVEELRKDGGAPGRALSATLLAQDCDARANQLLEWVLKEDRNHAVRAAAARGLGLCGNKESIPKLEQYLADSNDALRLMSAAAIIRLSMDKPPKPAELLTR